MGIIKPPWISQDWFERGPFNYCDHFGDKKLLAQVYKICHEEIFERVGASLAEDMAMPTLLVSTFSINKSGSYCFIFY